MTKKELQFIVAEW